MKKQVHVVPHTHWDREWYFTTSRSRVYLMHNFKRVLELLENKQGYDHFILDGQASLLDDYLKWRPQDKMRIKKLVQAGQLIIGPWYTQTDQLVISGESIVRNMLYGMRICNKFGRYMNVGYVPDSFGQSASMPQIYQSLGIEDTMFWRGVSDDQVHKTEYKWRGEDGSEVNVYQIPSGYYIGGAIPEKVDSLAKFLNDEPFKTTWKRSSTNQVYFPNGFDQAPPRENLPELIDEMNKLYDGEYEFQISTIESYIKAVKAQHPELEEISGELLNGKLMRIHKSIFSSRSDLKQMNTETQNYLVNTMEPLLSLGMAYGLEYPVETVREVWRLMFENAAHDSIGACVSDTTNEDIYMRYKQVRDITSNLVELTLREIATRIDNPQSSEISLTVFNPLSSVQNGVVETECYVPQREFGILDEQGNEISYTILEFVDQTEYVLNQGNILDPSKDIFTPNKVYKAKIALQLNDIPSVGYTQYTIDLRKNTLTELAEQKREILENEALKIFINDNGSLDILDKKTAITYKNQAILEENGDDGDSFNYSPPHNDLKIQSIEFKPAVKVVKSAILEIATITYEMLVPKDLIERAEGIRSTRLPVTMIVKLSKGQSTIDFEVAVDNRWVDSHRLCALFDTGIASKVSTADQQFGVIQRPVVRQPEMDLWHSAQEKWNEMPISIETCQSFVTLNDTQKGVAVFPKGVREYEIVGEKYDTIRLTLFRTYGYMGKENLIYRPGRASGESVVKTPNAQCHKQMSFSFTAYYYQGDVDSGEVANTAKIVNTRPLVYEYADFLNSRLIFTQSAVQKDLPTSDSLFKTSGYLTLSVIKKAEERPGMIIRLYNGHLYGELDEVITFKHPVKFAEWVDLKEVTHSTLEVDHNAVKVPTLAHAKFGTLYIEFE